MKLVHVVGARPNFMKTAPILREMLKYPGQFDQVLVHSGQHYDYRMSKVFFEDLGMPEPDHFLQTGAGSHAQQTAAVMTALEPVLMDRRPDWVVVVGDVNSTLAAALVAAKLGIPVAHVEAGLRSGDRGMPEEINRMITDRISSLHFTPSEEAVGNLMREGVGREGIHFVGNVMIDSLIRILPKVGESGTLAAFGLAPRTYALCTFHRPANVDSPGALREVVRALAEAGKRLPVIFPVHPRTRKKMAEMWPNGEIGAGIRLTEPLGYLDFVSLMRSARMVITDSGGVQEETTFLKVPCLTVRPNTERPVTIANGTNRLIRADCASMAAAVDQTLGEGEPANTTPPLWDGKAASRIVDVFRNL